MQHHILRDAVHRIEQRTFYAGFVQSTFTETGLHISFVAIDPYVKHMAATIESSRVLDFETGSKTRMRYRQEGEGKHWNFLNVVECMHPISVADAHALQLSHSYAAATQRHYCRNL